jgi:hypothetical protein
MATLLVLDWTGPRLCVPRAYRAIAFVPLVIVKFTELRIGVCSSREAQSRAEIAANPDQNESRSFPAARCVPANYYASFGKPSLFFQKRNYP